MGETCDTAMHDSRRHDISIFSVPKIGEADSSNQDSCDRSSSGHRIAVADGAGSSLYPRQWADRLVTHFCQFPNHPIEALETDDAEWLRPIQESWRQYYLAKAQSPKRKWWEAGSSTKDHASATFVGLCLGEGQSDSPSEGSSDSPSESQYEAIALGDSCLFHWQPETQSLQSFPVQTAQDFKSTTPCLESLPEYNHYSPQIYRGFYQKQDIFWLATDAIAQWILTEVGNSSIEWRVILDLNDHAQFRQLINRLRQEKRIKNDDTTLALVRPCS